MIGRLRERFRYVYEGMGYGYDSSKDGVVVGYEALSRIVKPQEISCSEELFHLAGIYGKV